jgi:hypothetical protein
MYQSVVVASTPLSVKDCLEAPHPNVTSTLGRKLGHVAFHQQHRHTLWRYFRSVTTPKIAYLEDWT